MLQNIKKCFANDEVYYSEHARKEMELDESGRIEENEVFEALQKGEIIKTYPEDSPYPSCLIFGKTKENRPIHIVCGYSEEEELTIVITVYEPDNERWINFRKRKET